MEYGVNHVDPSSRNSMDEYFDPTGILDAANQTLGDSNSDQGGCE
jgi:hypothetical protein